MTNRSIGAIPLQTSGRPTSRTPILTLVANLAITLTATLVFAPGSLAQATQPSQPTAPTGQPALTPDQQALAEDFYRAEFVILERRIEPSAVVEKMAGRLPEPPDLDAEQILRHTDESGASQTTLKLVPRNELYLKRAAERLEQSGKYRVLLAEGWYQGFPPEFQGKPLWVTLGDWLPGAGHTDVQGMITIKRQRYLHVDVRLNHWLPQSSTDNLLGLDLNAETPTQPHPPRIEIRPASPEDGSVDPVEALGQTAPPALIAGLNWPRAELLTWIQETRRMRSEEVHFLDSPTLGVLIFFKKIEPEEAAPMILRLGLSGKPAPQAAP